jgi:hypothetical protein
MSRPSPSYPDRTPASGEEIRTAEGESRTTINKSVTTLTRNDIRGLTPNPDINVPKTTVTVNYTVRKIPVPSTNNIRVLSASSKIWNKPQAILSQESGDLFYRVDENNVINGGGQSVNTRVSGDNNTAFKLVVKDITNTKWYNWDTEEFENGYNDIESTVGSGSFTLNFPSQTIETTYNTFFTNIDSTAYDPSLPTENNPWVTNQLINPTITFRFDDDKGYAHEQTTTKTHTPGDTLNSGSTNDGKIPITITTTVLRGGISLRNSTVKTENIGVEDDDIVIVSSDLTASVSGRVGTITGTITIGKSCKRDSDILFQPNDFFTIT